MFRRRQGMANTKKPDSGAAEGARRATEQSPESSALPGAGRWSAKRKTSVVLELLRGADLESTSRRHRVTMATLSEWRERFLAGGEAMLKSRENDAGRRRGEAFEIGRSRRLRG